MKEISKAEQIDNVIAAIWSALNSTGNFRRESEYGVVLFLASMKKEGVLALFSGAEQYEMQVVLLHILQDPNSYEHEVYYEIFNLLRPSIEKLSSKDLYFLIKTIDTIDTQLFENNFPDIFEGILHRMGEQERRELGAHMLPDQLSQFLCQIFELPDSASVYNPFAGMASFGIYLPSNISYLAQEIVHDTWVIGALRLLAHKKYDRSSYERGDSVESWNPSPPLNYGTWEEIFTSGREIEPILHDLIISSPPLGYRLPQISSGTGVTAEHFLIEKGIEDLKEGGKLIAIVSTNILFANSEFTLRKHLIDNDLVEAIILFPDATLSNTGIPIVVIVISRQNSNPSKVKMIDAGGFKSIESRRSGFELAYKEILKVLKEPSDSNFSKNVSIEEIISQEYSLHVPRFLMEPVPGIPLEAIVEIISGGKSNIDSTARLVRSRNLKDDPLDFFLDLTAIEPAGTPLVGHKIEQSCILVSTRWKSLKPTYFEYQGSAIFISNDICAMKVDTTKINIAFLVSELHSAPVKAQFGAFSVGSVAKFIGKKDLLSIKIRNLSISEQIEQIQSLNQVFIAKKRKELALTIHDYESELLEQNTHLRHSLAGPTSNLVTSIQNIRKIISEQILPSNPNIFELKANEQLPSTLLDYINVIERDSKKIESTVNNRLKAESQISNTRLWPIEIIPAVEKFVSELIERDKSGLHVSISKDEESIKEFEVANHGIMIEAEINLINDLLNNLTDNAVRHGFRDLIGVRLEIHLTLAVQENSLPYFQIQFSNSGHPFKEGFTIKDFTRKGSTAGPASNEGYGGWYINEIVKRLNGNFSFRDELGSQEVSANTKATTFIINLPILTYVTSL